MAVGTIHASIKLDHPDRIHYGTSAPVTGNVLLKFKSNNNTKDQRVRVSEFFGPMEIALVFHGRAKSKIRESRHSNNTTTNHTYRGRVPIFKIKRQLHNDSVKLPTAEVWPIPFELHFPPGFQSMVGDFKIDPRFDTSPEQALPPSFVGAYAGLRTHFESFVEYRLGIEVYVPHVSVNIIRADKYDEPLVRYAQPRSPATLERTYQQHRRRVRVSNEQLLPEADRPTGFRQKAKAKLSSDPYPHYKFDFLLETPRQILSGEPIRLKMLVTPREAECNAPVVPEIHLISVLVTLSGYTQVRAERQFFSTPGAEHDVKLCVLRIPVTNLEPFSAVEGWKKTMSTAAVPDTIAPSFRTVNIAQAHFFKVDLKFKVAGELFPYELLSDVVLLPPTESHNSNGETAASGTAAASFSQALDMQQVEEALPRYEALPEYDEAVNTGPVPPPKDARGPAPEGIA